MMVLDQWFSNSSVPGIAVGLVKILHLRLEIGVGGEYCISKKVRQVLLV